MESGHVSKSQTLYRGEELGIFPGPGTSLEEENSKFFQVPKQI